MPGMYFLNLVPVNKYIWNKIEIEKDEVLRKSMEEEIYIFMQVIRRAVGKVRGREGGPSPSNAEAPEHEVKACRNMIFEMFMYNDFLVYVHPDNQKFYRHELEGLLKFVNIKNIFLFFNCLFDAQKDISSSVIEQYMRREIEQAAKEAGHPDPAGSVEDLAHSISDSNLEIQESMDIAEDPNQENRTCLKKNK